MVGQQQGVSTGVFLWGVALNILETMSDEQQRENVRLKECIKWTLNTAIKIPIFKNMELA